MADLTWFGVGGSARHFLEPDGLESLLAALRRCADASVEVRILGEGANLIVPDEGVTGMVLRLAAPAWRSVTIEDGLLVAGAGAKLSQVMSFAIRHGLAGLEQMAGIPASLGGACVCNAGGREGDLGQRVAWVEVASVDGVERLGASSLGFDYRASSLRGRIVTRVALKLRPAAPDALRARYRAALATKKERQPLAAASGGCAFKNPRGLSARRLIEELGLAGLRIGGAEVSPKHGNFLLTHPGATARDILRLMEEVRATVRAGFGIELESELVQW